MEEDEEAVCVSVLVLARCGGGASMDEEEEAVLALAFGGCLALAASYLSFAASYLRRPLLSRTFLALWLSSLTSALVSSSRRFISSMMLVRRRWCSSSAVPSSVVMAVELAGSGS